MPTLSSRFRSVEVLLAVALVVLLTYRFGPELRTRAGAPATAPDLELVTLDGDTLRLAELRGTVVLVNFWATWCAPCRVEMPMLQTVWEEYRDRGFLVVGLYTDEGAVADLVAWYRDAGIRYPFARSTPAAERGLGFGGTLPLSLLIDGEGGVVARVEGIYPEPALRDELDRLLPPTRAMAPTLRPLAPRATVAGPTTRRPGRPAP